METYTREELLADLRRAFKKYLIEQGKTAFEANVICNDAFFLANQNLSVSFEDFLKVGVTAEIKGVLVDYFMLSGNNEYASTKANQYLNAMTTLYRFYISRFEATERPVTVSNDSGILVEYCRKMRFQYSYKPLLMLCLLETGSTNGSITISEVAHYFIEFYNSRLEQGLIAEKPDSIFSRKGVDFLDAKQNIISNAVKVYEKDGVLTLVGESIKLTAKFLYDYQHSKSEAIEVCKNIISNYYSKLNVNDTEEQEILLGSVLENMHSNASNSEKVVMIQLFGIKYGELIETKKLSIKTIISHSGVPASYYNEIRKGVSLSRYVILRENPIESYQTEQTVDNTSKKNSINDTMREDVSNLNDDDFLESCYIAVDNKLDVGSMEKKKRQIRVDRLKTTAVLYTSSKTYQRKDSDPFFWFGYHLHQQQILSEYQDAYVAFVLKDAAQCLLIPTELLHKYLPFMSQTEKETDFYWHIHIYKSGNKYFLNVPSKNRIDISAYCLF